jgi:hypothetical protein
MENEIKTPQTDPDHPVVGHYFKGTYGLTYYCESYDPSIGYQMNATDGSRRTNVSERAIGRTFHDVRYR